jgi:nitrogen fixation NifU-like protein
MSSQRSALHQELILDHFRRPRNRGTLEQPDASVVMTNPLCGDAIRLQLAFEGDRVREARFVGQGCSISQASASMMTQLVRGKTTAEVKGLADRFRQMIHGDAEAVNDQSLGDLRALSGVAKLPIREKCALMPWDALEEGIRNVGGPAGRRAGGQ